MEHSLERHGRADRRDGVVPRRVASDVCPVTYRYCKGCDPGHSGGNSCADPDPHRAGAILQDMKRLLLICGGITVVTSQLLAVAPPIKQAQFLSTVYTIDRKYRSMEGPSSVQKVYLGDREKPELLWIVGIRTEMAGEDGETPQLAELMCHVNVDLDPARHQALFDFGRPVAARLMTLSQGMLSATLPVGFGFPIASNEPLLLF